MQDIETTTVLKLQKDILKRYEPDFGDGLMFLYNVKTDKLWMGNSVSRELIKLIDGNKTIEAVYKKLILKYSNKSEQDLINLIESFNEILEDLLKKKFIEIIKK